MKTHTNDSQVTRIAVLENTISHINETLIRIENTIIGNHQELRQEVKKLDNRIWSNFYWAIGGFAAILGMLAKLLRWV